MSDRKLYLVIQFSLFQSNSTSHPATNKKTDDAMEGCGLTFLHFKLLIMDEQLLLMVK